MFILNAGLFLIEEVKSKQGIEMHMAVNHFAHFYLYQ